MVEGISWMYSVRAQSGPSVANRGELSVDAYEKLSLTVAVGATQNVTIGPGTWADVQGLVVSASDLSGTLTLAPEGGTAIVLDGPLVLVGAGPVALLGAGDATLVLENIGPEDIDVDVFVARDATR
jgi:hypothetical protein